jgi:hypothetical protein
MIDPWKGYYDSSAQLNETLQRQPAVQLARMQLAKGQQEMDDDAAVRNAMQQSGGDLSRAIPAVAQTGNVKAAMGLQKMKDEQLKSRQDTELNRYKIAAESANRIASAPLELKKQVAKEEIIKIYQMFGGEDPTAHLQYVDSADPQTLHQDAISAAISAKERLPKFEHFDAGGSILAGGVNPVTGQFTQTGSVQKTATPGEFMADKRGQETLKETARGHTLTKEAADEKNRLKDKEIGVIGSGIVDKQTRETELKLQDDYRAESKGWAEVSTSMKKVMGSLDSATTNAGSALAAGTAFMKILDPNSVVRETELGLALNASGWFDRASNVVNTIKSGKVMTPTQVANLKAASTALFEEAKKAQLDIDAAFEKRTKSYGGDPARVIVERGQGKLKPTGATPGKIGRFTVEVN